MSGRTKSKKIAVIVAGFVLLGAAVYILADDYVDGAK
jgi:hypothetical protein